MGKFFKEATKIPKVINLPQSLHLEKVLAKRKARDAATLADRAGFLIRRSNHPQGKPLTETESAVIQRFIRENIVKRYGNL